MSQLSDGLTPFIARGLDKLSDWIKQFGRTPTPKFITRRDEILHAVTLAMEFPSTRPTAVALTLAVFPLIENSDSWVPWRPLFETFPNYFDEFDLPTRAYLLNRLGQLYRLSGQMRQAIAIHQDALALAEQTPNDKLLLHAVQFQLGEDYLRVNDLAKAEAYAQRAYQTIADNPDQEIAVANAALTLGYVMRLADQRDEAVRWYRTAVSIYQKHQQSVELARALTNLGVVLVEQGQFAEGLSVYKQATAEGEKGGSYYQLIWLKYNMGVLYMAQKRYDLAEVKFREAAHDIRRNAWQDLRLQAQIDNNLGYVILNQGRYSEAESYLRQALDIWNQLEDDLGAANCLESVAESVWEQDRKAEGCALYRQALTLVVNQRGKYGAANLYQEILAAYRAHCPETADDNFPDHL